MKAVPKVNTDGLYLEDTIMDDAFTGVVPFYADPPAQGSELPPETDTEAEDEQPGEEQQPAGYIVGIPVPPGLYLPRFDLKAWQTYQDAVTAAQAAYQTAYAEWAAQPEDERGEPPAYTAPEQPVLWGEGLTPEEIEALRPPAEPTELELLRAELEEIRSHNAQLQTDLATASAGLAEVKTTGAEQEDMINTIGSESIVQELNLAELKQQSSLLGGEMINHDLAIADLRNQVEVLGQMVIALELKLMANKEGDDSNADV
ncbi:hypothetical protein [Paenibacillus timonensis]|uniref:hypothetical protein n=1 Tax=Paenibacillus timonensis TaxID=225915 RepID=UPI003F9A9A5B